MPDGAAQLYLRDASANLIECDYLNIGELDGRIVSAARHWSDFKRIIRVERERVTAHAEQHRLALGLVEP